MHIEFHIPRPGVTLLAVAALSGWTLYFTGSAAQNATVTDAGALQAAAQSSSVQIISKVDEPVVPSGALENLADAQHIHDDSLPATDDENHLTQAEMRMKWARAEQEFIRQRQEVIRLQLEGLAAEREALGGVIDPELEEQFRRSAQLLTSLVKDEKKAEQFLLMTYRQQWEAEEHAMTAATGTQKKPVSLLWPVEPSIGISAYFLDPGYKERFKVEHYAIDIPVPQGTDVLVAGDGIVKDVVDHGLGYNYITVDHGGYATVYGHMSEFSVRPGVRVRAGDRLGKSGGMPGLRGGGYSTGPHLHFGLYVQGKPVDPLTYLPKWSGR